MADQKTEKPTARRLEKTREEGNFPTARTFVSALQFLAFVALLHAWGPGWTHQLQTAFIGLLELAMNPRWAPMDLAYRCLGTMKQLMTPVAIFGAVMIGITLGLQLIVTGFGISFKKLMPDLKRLDPLSHLKNLPKQNLPALLQAMMMLPVFGLTIYYLVKDNLAGFLSLPLNSLSSGVDMVTGSIQSLLWKASGLFVVFGLVDLVRQQSRYRSELKMSKQEIHDEMKEMEGNPAIKHRMRRLRRDLLRRRMMQDVATASAVIVNPTHYAVAIKYSLESKGAPLVVAKGQNYLALRIRQRALENQIPLIENPPLAQGLYRTVEVGREIPAEFYKAVAEVLAYIYRVMDGRRQY